MISGAVIDYKTFSKDRLPKIGIYYIFKNYKNIGLCKEYKLDIPELINNKKKIITPLFTYSFFLESKLLMRLGSHGFQAIRTEIPQRLSFKNLAELIAEVHFQDFLKKNFWLK